MAQVVKNLPAMQKTWVQSLGQEGPLVKEMATHSSILDQKILWTEGTWWDAVYGVSRVGHDLATKPQPQPRCEEVVYFRNIKQWSKSYTGCFDVLNFNTLDPI